MLGSRSRSATCPEPAWAPLARGIALILLAPYLAPLPAARSSGETDPLPLVAGVGRICPMGLAGPVFPVAEGWRPVAAGDEDTTFPSTFAAARTYGAGRVLVLGHEGLLINPAAYDNGHFLKNAVAWLDTGHTHSARDTTGHGEWAVGGALDGLRQALAPAGVTLSDLEGFITTERLSGAGVLLVGNAWGDVTPAEVEAVRQWVEAGGGLLMAGLGWSWDAYHPDRTMEDYPMTRLAAPYGIRWLHEIIDDPTDNDNGAVIYHTFTPDLPPGGISDALALLNAEHDAHPSTLADDLEADAALRRRVVQAHLTLAVPGREFPAGDPARQLVYDGFADLAERRPGFYGRQAPLDQTIRPTAAWLRERFLRTWADALPPTAEGKARIIAGVGLTGRRADLLREDDIALLDNMRLSYAQLEFLYRLFALIPPTMHDLRTITVRDFLGQPPMAVPLEGNGFTVNIIGWPIGAAAENSFPADVPPGETDIYAIVAVHEANHVVDATCVERNSALRARRGGLIAEAGRDARHYLRSMLPDGFFADNPQEFLASIANQWFTDSAKTIRLGLERFDHGEPDPINQALFFADVYARGGDTTLLYTLDPAAHLTRAEAPLHRDPDGRTDGITLGVYRYDFTLDGSGRVTAYTRTRLRPTLEEARDSLRAAAGLLAPGPGSMERLDVGEDGAITLADALALLRRAAGG